jgi:nitrogen-specific signal transduction histidine kinase/ActR/RegA family two-component response regulator
LTIDVTDKKNAEKAKRNLEKEIRQTHKMEAIGTLAGGIAHDFNNILSGVFGYAQLAKNNIDTPAKLDGHIDQIIKGASRAAGLIQQILTFSRQSEQEKIVIRISAIVKEAVRLLRSSIPATIEIREKIYSKSKILTDPTQIHQVIMNLCTNAYHAMRDKGGVLTVELSDIRLPDEKKYPDISLASGDYIAITVKDTGCGIDENALQKVFDPYFTTKQIGEGTGLGLSIVYGIVEDHNGLIKVSSSIDKGSVFRLFFPISHNTLVSKTPKKDVRIPRGKERVIIVDDEESVLLSTQENLEDNGYRVSAFMNPVNALKEFKTQPDQFDLIISDMTMPGITGDILSKEMLKIRPKLPIILCTGYSETFNESTALEMGIKRFVQKPIDMEKLLHLIRDVLDEGQMSNGS